MSLTARVTGHGNRYAETSVVYPDGREIFYRSPADALRAIVAWGEQRGLFVVAMSPESETETIVTYR